MIRLRPALPSDLATLMRWDEQTHVIESDPNDDWSWETELLRNPEWRELLMAEWDDRPVGFIQIIDPAKEETRYWGDSPDGIRALDIWIGSADDLGKGYGTAMMHLALDRCFADALVQAVWVDPLASNLRAHRFYEKLGFRFVEGRRFGEDDCKVFALNRQDWHN
jgi:aminoglycoside 6'-N-acetyltransferase